MSGPGCVAGLQRLNGLSDADFAAALAGVFEHSPWVAEAAAGRRPFASARALFDAMVGCIADAGPEQRLALIRVHPELAGAEAETGTLTAASSSEQARLGLDRLAPRERQSLAELNRRYREKFGFPCIIALRLHADLDSVIDAFRRRLDNGRDAEIGHALDQICAVARGRLARVLGLSDGRLTVHALDSTNGLPASGMAYDLAAADGAGWTCLAEGRTNTEGRSDAPLLSDIDMAPGRYRLRFRVGAYFRARGAVLAEPTFLEDVPIEFGLAEPGQHYHVPLVCTPWSYATYRGG